MSRTPAVLIALLLLLAACGSSEESPSRSASRPIPGGSAPGAGGSGEPQGSGPVLNDDSLQVHTVATGLNQPTNMAVLDAESFFVTEKPTGRVYLVQDGELGDPVLDLAVNFFDERGLLGIALHPDFAAEPYVYLYWTASGEGEGEDDMFGADTEEEFALPDLGNRVDRFTWDGARLTWDRNIVQLRSNTLDSDTSGRIRGNHDAGPIVFGPDGTLFVVIGDQNLRGQLQNLPEGPAPDDANFTGVILRVNDDGSIPTDNPFQSAGEEIGGEVGENIQAIWAYGIRNSFGLAVHPDTGALWETENGDDSWDEVNILPAGSNSGWWQIMGPSSRFDEYRQIEVDSEDGTDNPDVPPDQLADTAEAAQDRFFELEGSTFVEPAFAWKFPVAVTSIGFMTDDSLGEPSTNTAWLGTVLTDSLYRYPLADDGTGFDFAGDAGLSDLVDDNTQKGDLGESAAYVVGTGFGTITHIVRGADDALYVVSLTGGSVYRISAAGSPAPATAVPAPVSSPGASAPAGGEVVEITIGTDTGTELLFDPVEASVPAGATVRLTFVNESTVPHNLTFGEPINAATANIVQPGEEETIEFTAADAGDYTFVCTLHPGMEGVLTVE